MYLADIFRMIGDLLTHASFWIMLAYLSEMNSCAKNFEKCDKYRFFCG